MRSVVRFALPAIRLSRLVPEHPAGSSTS